MQRQTKILGNGKRIGIILLSFIILAAIVCNSAYASPKYQLNNTANPFKQVTWSNYKQVWTAPSFYNATTGSKFNPDIAVIGMADGSILAFEKNSGSGLFEVCTDASVNPFYNTPNAANGFSAPILAEVSGTATSVDMIVGQGNGTIVYYEDKSTTPKSPNPFANVTSVGGETNNIPAIVEINSKKYLIAGSSAKGFKTYEGPNFTLLSGTSDPFNGYTFISDSMKPAFTKLEETGLPHLFSGEKMAGAGRLRYYENTSSTTISFNDDDTNYPQTLGLASSTPSELYPNGISFIYNGSDEIPAGVFILYTNSSAGPTIDYFERVTVTCQKGDVNCDSEVKLDDAILALKISAGISPDGLQLDAASIGAIDVDGDLKIGLGEAIKVLIDLAP